MIDVKAAANQAFNFVKELYPDLEGTLIEEVEMDDTKKYWFITISFIVKNDKLTVSVLSPFSGFKPEFERKYKTVKIDANSGEIISMKIRELQK